MKLLYATSMTFPSTRANRVQTLAMARAFSERLGTNFLFGLSKGEVDIPHVLMGVKRSIFLAWDYLALARREQYAYILCREERLLLAMMLWSVLLRAPLTFIYEAHHLGNVSNSLYRWMLKRCNLIVVLTDSMQKELLRWGIEPERIVVAPDGVNVSLFDISLSKNLARERTALPLERPIALYAGAIDEEWKGAHIFATAAKELPQWEFVIVGGKAHYVDWFKNTYAPAMNVRLLGYKDYERELPTYLKAADVLVIPNSGKHEISRVSTSPLKLFAYMAAGRPIVASDLPSLREVIDDTMAVLVAPDDGKALAQGVVRAKAEGEPLATRAREAVGSYTWDARAEHILTRLL